MSIRADEKIKYEQMRKFLIEFDAWSDEIFFSMARSMHGWGELDWQWFAVEHQAVGPPKPSDQGKDFSWQIKAEPTWRRKKRS